MGSRRHLRRPRGRHLAGTSVLAVALFLVAGCADDGNDGDDPGTDPPITEPGEQTTDPGEDETGENTDPEEGPPDQEDPQVEAAVDDLAEREGVDPAEIEVGTLEAVTWSDGSIGCPEEGMSYTQALVDGHRLILTLDGEEFYYHAGGEDELSYCADPIEPADAPATS